MKLLFKTKEKVLRYFNPLVTLLVRRGLHPHLLTLSGLFFSFIAAYAFFQGWLRWGGILVIFSGFCDFLDGPVARSSKKNSIFGAFLDSTVDRYSEIVIYGGLFLYYLKEMMVYNVLLALTGSLMVSYTRARAESIGQECRVGLLERPERMIILSGGALLGEEFLKWSLFLVAIFAHLTALQRIHFIWQKTKQKE